MLLASALPSRMAPATADSITALPGVSASTSLTVRSPASVRTRMSPSLMVASRPARPSCSSTLMTPLSACSSRLPAWVAMALASLPTPSRPYRLTSAPATRVPASLSSSKAPSWAARLTSPSARISPRMASPPSTSTPTRPSPVRAWLINTGPCWRRMTSPASLTASMRLARSVSRSSRFWLSGRPPMPSLARRVTLTPSISPAPSTRIAPPEPSVTSWAPLAATRPTPRSPLASTLISPSLVVALSTRRSPRLSTAMAPSPVTARVALSSALLS